jgi:hypothetical protein
MSVRRTFSSAALVAAVGLGLPVTSSAQVSVEFKNVFSVGSHSATAAALDFVPGFGFEVLAGLGVGGGIEVFGGLSRIAFGCNEGFCANIEPSVKGNHLIAGVARQGGLTWIRAAVLHGTAEVDLPGGEADSGLGFRAGAGLSLGSGSISVRPGLSVSRMAAGSAAATAHAAAVGAELGIRYTLR